MILLLFALSLYWTCYWTNNRGTGDFRRHVALMTLLWYWNIERLLLHPKNRNTPCDCILKCLSLKLSLLLHHPELLSHYRCKQRCCYRSISRINNRRFSPHNNPSAWPMYSLKYNHSHSTPLHTDTYRLGPSLCYSTTSSITSKRARSWNNGVRCMSFYILMNLWYDRIASWDIRVLVVFAPALALCHWHEAFLPC